MKRRYLLVSVLVLVVISGAQGGESMVFPGKEWQKVSPELQGVDSGKLKQAVAFLEKNSGADGVKELVIVRNGYMIWEGPNVDKVHGVWSLTKSFTSTVLGLLVEDGKATLDTRAKDIVPCMAQTYPGVTLRHFTTMTSGYYAIGDEPRGGYRHGPSTTPFKPADKPLFKPGENYAYWDSAMNQFGNCLTQIAGESMEELFKQRIADPIGMNAEKWRWGDFGKINGLEVNGGSGNGNKHVFICARELARFGHLFLNGGKWKGKQLIDAGWVKMATRPHVKASIELHPLSGADGRGVYGFNWWANGIGADGKRKWPAAPVGMYSASGYNNNDMFVIPRWNMVVVRLGLDQNSRKITDETYGTFISRIGQSLTK